jgi:hypothetical protein
MRIWDIHPKHLCRKHLLGEHRELHGLWNILTKHKVSGGPARTEADLRGGYSKHPETLRWVGKEKALYVRHEALVKEFLARGYKHHTPLSKKLALGKANQNDFINTAKEQKAILKNKPCECLLDTK